MSNNWMIGNYVKVRGVGNDFKILSYNFILNGYVEMILEAPEGNRIFLKRRKSQVQPINAARVDNKANILVSSKPDV